MSTELEDFRAIHGTWQLTPEPAEDVLFDPAPTTYQFTIGRLMKLIAACRLDSRRDPHGARGRDRLLHHRVLLRDLSLCLARSFVAHAASGGEAAVS